MTSDRGFTAQENQRMQMDEAKRKRETWGKKPCPHPGFDKEYYLGSQTGDYNCIRCGESFTYQQMEALRQKRAKAGQGKRPKPKK